MTTDTPHEQTGSLGQTVVATLSRLTWDQAAFIVLALVALALRLWAVGARAISFDESEHVYFSWLFATGGGYTFDPITHGPFLFFFQAFIYLIFGASDATSRLGPALFGTALVVLPYFLRKWMGKLGALAAGVMLAISPTFLFYSRDILHEMYNSVWALLMAIALLKFLDERKSRYIYMFGIATALYICEKATVYIAGFIFVTFVLVALVWENLKEPVARQIRTVGLGVGGVAAVAAVWVTQQSTPILPGNFGQYFALLVCFLVAALLAGWAWRRNSESRAVAQALSAIHWRTVLTVAAIGIAIIVALYTTLFTNPRGIVGPVTLLTYWIGQHAGARGGQPWYYLLFLSGVYEFLPLVGAIAAIIYYSFVRRGRDAFERLASEGHSVPFVPFLIFWTIMAMALHSWSGEKMPQHLLYVTLPMILLTGRLAQDWFGRVDWQNAWKKRAPLLGLLLVIAGYTVIRLFSLQPFKSMSLASLNQTAAWILALIVLGVLVWGLWYYATKMGRRLALQASAASIAGVLFLLTVRTSWMANYINYDTAKEFIVYAHGTPDAKVTVNEILDISKKTVGDNSIKIAYDDRTGFPLSSWYFRDFPNATSFYGGQPNADVANAAIIIVHTSNEANVKPYLGDRYVRFQRRLMWWPMEEYKDLTPKRIVGELSDPARRSEIWNILWNREYPRSLNDWYYREEFALYIRKDLADQLWDYGTGAPLPTEPAPEDPYLQNHSLRSSTLIVGQAGQLDGQLTDPRDVAVDAQGNVYVADSGNNRIQVFDPQGNFLRQWGATGSGPGQFDEPWGIAVDKDGNVYVSDTWNYRVQKFDSQGNFLTQWGNTGIAGELPGEFYGPRAIAIASDGTILVADTGNKRIQRFTPDGQFVASYGGFGIEDGQFWEPVGLAVDKDGYIYVADTWNQRIQKFDANFNFVAKWPISTWSGQSVVNKPYLAVDALGHLYASDPEGYRVLEFTTSGDYVASFGAFGVGPDGMNLPTGLAVDAQNNLWVADTGNGRVLQFPPMP